MIATEQSAFSTAIDRLWKSQFDADGRKQRARRFELDAADSELFREEMRRQNAAWKRNREHEARFMMASMIDGQPWPHPEEITRADIFKVPCWLDCAESRAIVWDDYECWQVLSATLFTPNPK